MKFIKPLTVIVLLVASQQSLFAEECANPLKADVMQDYFNNIQRKAAYASFLEDECGIENGVRRNYSDMLVATFDDIDILRKPLTPKRNSIEQQQEELGQFEALKRNFSKEVGFLHIKKLCLVDTNKTKALINDATHSILEYLVDLNKIKFDYVAYKDCMKNNRATPSENGYVPTPPPLNEHI